MSSMQTEMHFFRNCKIQLLLWSTSQSIKVYSIMQRKTGHSKTTFSNCSWHSHVVFGVNKRPGATETAMDTEKNTWSAVSPSLVHVRQLALTSTLTCSLMTTCDISAVSVKPLISWKPNCGCCWWCVVGGAMATAGTGMADAGIPAPMATAGVGMGMCSGSSGCGVDPSFAGRLGADNCGSSLSNSDVSFRYEPGVRSCTLVCNVPWAQDEHK